jgi:hypothetical protein
MIDGNEYIAIIKRFYSFLETEFDFTKRNETINSNAFYDVEFNNNEKVISISYENIEEHLEIIIFMLQDDKIPNYDDKTKTLHLTQLNSLVFAKTNKEDINLNAEYFTRYSAKNEIEQKLLKGAKELRLYLMYFNELM